MKALILNSGMGSRLGQLTANKPKCLAEISPGETILGRQLKQIIRAGISEVIITTGYCDAVLVDYCNRLELPLSYTFVKNPEYKNTNYIYSIYCARELLNDEILLMHGDLVFDDSVLQKAANSEKSCVIVTSAMPLSEKDFKAVIKNGKIERIGIECCDGAVAAQPLYHLYPSDWRKWLKSIKKFCEAGETQCYAENALNDITEVCNLWPLDVADMLCCEIDDQADLTLVLEKLKRVKNQSVYMCFSTDILHSGHMEVIKQAANLGQLTIGVLSDAAVATYKRFPLLPFDERRALFENIKGVSRVVEQKELSYRNILLRLKPDIVVHGDDWRNGFQEPLRREVVEILSTYGGELIELPYARDPKYQELEQRSRLALSLPDNRRSRLRKLLTMKKLVTAMEAHDGISGLVVENTVVHDRGKAYTFDAMWVSSLCDSVAKGKPDIELVDMTSRFRTIDDLTEVTTKPIIFDGDTGGKVEHFVYTVKTLEKMGVSAIIIEDKKGLKRNSLFGTEVVQEQESIEEFSMKITAGKRAQKTPEFMIIARIESLILEKGLDDALERAFAFVRAGADGIMIHSRKEDPGDIFEFIEKFRLKNEYTPLVVVPTAFHAVTEDEFMRRGVNIVIYANHLLRSEVPAMQRTAEEILKHHRSLEQDTQLMPFQEIIRMIPLEM